MTSGISVQPIPSSSHSMRRRRLFLALLLLAFISTLIYLPPPSPPLALSRLLIFFGGIALLAAAAKSTPLSPSSHADIDRFAAALALSTLLYALNQHVLIAAAADTLFLQRFVQFFLAGGVCAFLTHAFCTPIDVIKTRIQTTSLAPGLVPNLRKILSEEGPAALLQGLGATAAGYFLHGGFKYSFYEVFKVLYSPTPAVALKPPLSIAAAAGFCAECIACLLLSPMEAVRIRSVSDPTFPPSAPAGLRYIYTAEGMHGLYKGLPAMLLKQVPYTVGQFVAFEYSVVTVRRLLAPLGPGTVSALAGVLAGIFAAVISQPGDTILSKVNQEEGDEGCFVQIQRVVRAAGISGLFAGLSVRVVQVACMIGGQFLIYDTIKLMFGIVPASAVVAVASVAGAGTGIGVSVPILAAVASEAAKVAVDQAPIVAPVAVKAIKAH